MMITCPCKLVVPIALAAGLFGVGVATIGHNDPSAPLPAASGEPRHQPSWRSDPAWHQGKAEWAVYDATRTIYGSPRSYEATIFTNVQHMDPTTTVKAADWRKGGSIPVFKHNVREVVPTDNYDYKFLTTCFVRSDTLQPYKVVMSSQEDCGATYKQFVIEEGDVHVRSFSYFPGDGAAVDSYRAPGRDERYAFHDALTLTLRDFPFDSVLAQVYTMKLVPDQTDNHATPARPADASAHLVARETIAVPYGEVETYHLRVDHDTDGGVTESHYWFAADPGLRHVLVRYRGPWGVEYRLKHLGWWAYWSDPKPG